MALAAIAAGVRHVHRLKDKWLHERARPKEFVTEEEVDDALWVAAVSAGTSCSSRAPCV
jgi:hypothetical protein